MEEESLSDDDAEIFDELEQGEGRGGTTPGRQNCQRDFEAAHQQLLNDYFSGTPVYKEYQFERRFGMPRTIFNRIYDELKEIEECTAHTIECIKIDSFKTRKVHAANQHPVDCFFSLLATCLQLNRRRSDVSAQIVDRRPLAKSLVIWKAVVCCEKQKLVRKHLTFVLWLIVGC